MASRESKYIRDFKAMTKGALTFDDVVALESEMYGENDRATIVMSTVIVESALEVFVKDKLRPTINSDDNRLLFDYVGPLGTFSSKTLIAYAFNFFGPETRHDLDLIRTLRNGFAHSRRSFGFTTPEVATLCAELKSPEWDGASMPLDYLRKTPAEGLVEVLSVTGPRNRWIIACHTLTYRLLRNAGRPGRGSIPGLR